MRHMLDAACEALSFVKGRTRTDLDQDRMLVLALIKDIEIVGEAAYQVSETTRVLYELSLGLTSLACAIVSSMPSSIWTLMYFGRPSEMTFLFWLPYLNPC